MTSTQPTTPSSTPAYPPNIGLHLAGDPNLGVIPEHLAEGMNNIFRVGAGGSPSRGGADSGGNTLIKLDILLAIVKYFWGFPGADSGSAPCTPTPTPFSPSPAQVGFRKGQCDNDVKKAIMLTNLTLNAYLLFHS